MSSAVCTLFEGDYHYGVGALVNSLYRNGFRGVVWAGYRGALPPWASAIRECGSFNEFTVAEGCIIRFVPVNTSSHLTNYKPEFMLDLWKRQSQEIASLFYFDPDIVIKCRWNFFEEWADAGVALCEDMNSPFSRSHPIRIIWQNLAERFEVSVHRNMDIYANGGFLGVAKKHIGFLHIWEQMQKIMDSYIGDRSKVFLENRTHPFHMTDQDALNMCLMFSNIPYSIIGKEGMDFIPGGYTMSHAAGSMKPWKKSFTVKALSGFAPTLSDKFFFANSTTPINLYSSAQRIRTKIDLRFGSAIGRLVKKS